MFFVGLLRIELSLHLPHGRAVPACLVCRGARNRTAATNTPCSRTTTILHPGKQSRRVLPVYYSPKNHFNKLVFPDAFFVNMPNCSNAKMLK